MKVYLKLTAIVLATVIPFSAQAHKAWLLPSSTVVTPNEWITVDAAVSNDIFYFNHVPLRIDNLAITAPDGSTVTPQNISTGKYRTTFDLQLAQNGTYRISNGNSGLNASYKIGEETKRWRGTPETFAKEIPADAKELQVTQSQSRVETFVTAGKPSALKTSGIGLELVPVTHPNDLFAGELANFKLVIDGPENMDAAGKALSGTAEFIDATHAWIFEQALRQRPEVVADAAWPGNLGRRIEKARPPATALAIGA